MPCWRASGAASGPEGETFIHVDYQHYIQWQTGAEIYSRYSAYAGTPGARRPCAALHWPYTYVDHQYNYKK